MTDSGSGVGAGEICRIFEGFFKTRETGAGFGFAAVYGTVPQNKGWLDAAIVK